MQDDQPMRISKTEFSILHMMMNEGSELYGLEMLKKSNGRLKRGTIYTTLSRMEDKGLIASKKEASVQEGMTTKRRMYTISGAGVSAFNNFRNEVLGFASGGIFA